MAAGIGFTQNLVLWSEAGYFDAASESKPLLHLWSLGIEEQFYIFWPFLLWGAQKLRLNFLAVAVALATKDSRCLESTVCWCTRRMPR